MRNPGILVGFKVQRHGTAALQKFSVPPLRWGVGRFRLVCVRGFFFGGIELEMEGEKKTAESYIFGLCAVTQTALVVHVITGEKLIPRKV